MNNFSGKHTEQLLDYWLNLPNPQGIPDRSAVDPISLGAALLPHIFLCSVKFDPFEVNFRLQGTFINDLLGQNFKGKKLGPEIFGEAAEEIRKIYQRVAEDQKPILSHELINSSSGAEQLIEVLHLPLLGARGDVEYIMGAIDVLDKDRGLSEIFVSDHWVIQTSSDLTID